MDNRQAILRIEELLKERHMTFNELKENTNISTTVYQWKKNARRDATRVPSLRSIEKICNYLGISLSYFFADTPEEKLSVKQAEVMNYIGLLSEEEADAIINLLKLLVANRKK